MVFDNAVFIKPDVEFNREFSFENYAPIFRKKFYIDEVKTARLYVCGLGIGYYYINGRKVSEDLFTVPFSNYMKTLWYCEYDVAHLLEKGENVIAVFCGNGYFNETLDTKTWGLEKAMWRDLPKVILRLEADEKTVLVSDDSFKCLPVGATYFNQLRRGEYFDANLYDERITFKDYDDREWKYAKKDYISPTGVFRKCECEPIRECEVLEPVHVRRTGEKRYLFDMGQNISGYIRLTVTGQKNDLLTIRYCEEITDDFRPEYNKIDVYPSYFQREGFQTDKFICSGKKITWSPRFTYHGFRYIEIDGIRDIATTSVKGVFVHQAVKRRTEFQCSNPFLNQLFQAGVCSTYSNMFYTLTDCPTREKMAWTNDFMASAEQAMVNFECENLFEKCQQDIQDAMLRDGSLPGIIPSAGWWYCFDLGPIGDGVLFEVPYRLYLHTGNDSLLKRSLPYFEKYFRYHDGKKDEKGLTHYGLGDWSPPVQGFHEPDNKDEVSAINAILECHFYRIAAIADPGKYLQRAAQAKQFAIQNFIDETGRCCVNTQCTVAMMIYYDLYEDIRPLKQQLAQLVEDKDYHLSCGMVGMRRLLLALNKCGLHEYAYKVLTAEGSPGYKYWLDNGATTLFERWEPDQLYSSHNHHMFSDYMSWMIKTLAGISSHCENGLIYKLEPVFLADIDYVNCSYNSFQGRISVCWERKDGEIHLTVEREEGVSVCYQGKLLEKPVERFKIRKE